MIPAGLEAYGKKLRTHLADEQSTSTLQSTPLIDDVQSFVQRGYALSFHAPWLPCTYRGYWPPVVPALVTTPPSHRAP